MKKIFQETEEIEELNEGPDTSETFMTEDKCLRIEVGPLGVSIDDADDTFSAMLEVSTLKEIYAALARQGVTI